MGRKLKISVNGEKSWWQSKTLWVNVLLLTSGLLSGLAGELQTSAVLTVPAIVNLILRVVTKNGLKWK